MKNESERIRSDATIEYQQRTDRRMRQQYPLATLDNGVANRYFNGEFVHISFLPQAFSELTSTLLLTALARAADPTDMAAYSEHGAEHGTIC